MAGETDIVTSTAQGAATGYTVGGVYGAIIGGAIGLVGGLFSRKAKKYKKMAAREEKIMAERQQAIQRRDMVRNLRMARAQALVAGSSETGGGGSAVQGAVGSIGTQGTFNLNFFDTQVQSQKNIERWVGKAERRAEIAGAISGLMNAGGGAMGGMGMMGGGGSKSTSSAPGYSDTPSSMQNRNTMDFQNYGTIPMLG